MPQMELHEYVNAQDVWSYRGMSLGLTNLQRGIGFLAARTRRSTWAQDCRSGPRNNL